MRIISKKRLEQAAQKHPKAKSTIDHWHRIAKAASWKHFADTKRSFAYADQVAAGSGRTTTVFNITDAFRLITAIHYNGRRIYILRFLTHADYSKDTWKKDL